MKRFFVVICMFLCFLPCQVKGANEKAISLDARSAVVIEPMSGKVLYEKAKNQKLAPASVTKVMSLLLIFEEIDQQRLKKSDMVTVSEHAASMGGSQVFLEVGEQQSVDTLLKCMIISSANDATVAMAEKVAGSEASFVERMNQKAKKLGMKHTTFKNCCGLDKKGHETTAYDIALMSKELILKHPGVFHYTKIWMDSFQHKTKKGNQTFGLSNTNKLIRQYPGCTGLKTGSTSVAKFCLSATAKRNGIQMLAVVMASTDSKTRIKDASKLLDYGFSCCHKIKRMTTDGEIGNIEVINGKEPYVLYPKKITSSFVLTESMEGKIEKQVVKKKVYAPVKKGQSIGRIIFRKKGKIIFQQDILAQKSVKEALYQDYIKKVVSQYF